MKLLLVLLAIVGVFLFFQFLAMSKALAEANNKLGTFGAESVNLSYGKMTYYDTKEENKEILLSIHGLFGGYDQAYENVGKLAEDVRIICPSRFGYLGSELKGLGTPKEQVEAFVDLLNYLEIDQVFVLGASAGGTFAIRMALDYPERVKGLILLSSAMPADKQPQVVAKLLGPPDFLNHNFIMWLLSPFFPRILSMRRETIHWMLPIYERRLGVHLDATINNQDMLRNFEDYPIEDLKVPVILIHAKDDKTAKYEDVAKSLHRYPHLSLCITDTGGHLMEGNETLVSQSIVKFIEENK